MQFYPSPCAPGTHSQIRPSRAESTREQAATAGLDPPWATRPSVPQCYGQHNPSSYQYSSRRQRAVVRGRRVHPLILSGSTIPQENARGKRDWRIFSSAPPRGYVRLASDYQPLVSWRKWVSQEGITVVCIRKTKRSRGKKGELVKRATSWGSPQRCFPKSLPWAEGSLGPDLGFIENGAFA
jgi:hypothetical protein